MTAWHDLSHPLHPGIPHPPSFPPPRFERVLELGETSPEVHQFVLCTHMGTHIDAPSHFIAGGGTVDQIPVERLTTTAVVWGLDCEPGQLIDAGMLEQQAPTVEAGEAVLLWTGWGDKYGDPQYLDHPYLAEDAAQWLVEHEVAYVAMDVMTPDLPIALRSEGFNFPVHRTLMGAGTLVVENLAAADALVGHRVEVVVGAIRLEGLDGAPARILARIIDA